MDSVHQKDRLKQGEVVCADILQKPSGWQPGLDRTVSPVFSKARKQSDSTNKEVDANGKSDEGGRPNLLREQR